MDALESGQTTDCRNAALRAVAPDQRRDGRWVAIGNATARL